MNTWDAIRSRRNVRRYHKEAIPPEHLDQILEAGRRTPSARNRQPWDFVVVTDPGDLATLASCWEGAGHVAESAATIGIVAPTEEDGSIAEMVQYDLGQLTMTMMLAATDLGIGSAHAWVEDQSIARIVLGYPENSKAAWLLTLGYPADRPLGPISKINRRPFDEVVHRGRW